MFSYPDILIVKLEEHLKHIAGGSTDDNLRLVGATTVLFRIFDEVELMLALIEGAKEF